MRVHERLAAPFIVAALGATGCDEPKEEPAQLAALQGRVEAFAKEMDAMHRGLSDVSALKEQKCDEAAINRRLGSKDGLMLSVEYEEVVRLATGGIRSEGRDRWKFLTTPAARKLSTRVADVKSATDTLYTLRQLRKQYPFVGVVRLTKRDLPRLDGDRFHAGVLEGWVVVVDFESNERLCQARFVTQSSELVSGVDRSKIEKALWQDFARRARSALDGAVDRITRRARLDL